MTDSIVFPISETFDSIQGEGNFVGTPMFFIRFAGCNVGVYQKPEETAPGLFLQVRDNPRHSVCTTAIGQQFMCDTDYHATEKVALPDLIKMVPYGTHRVCLTGGEPFMQKNLDCLATLLARTSRIHIETSGTLPIPSWVSSNHIWVTCSPKKGFIGLNADLIDEMKFVIDEDSDVMKQIQKIAQVVGTFHGPVYLSPANGISTLNPKNTQAVLELLKVRKDWRISLQLHKLLQVR